MSSECTIEIECDSSPLKLFAEFVDSRLQQLEGPLNIVNCEFEFARVESNNHPTEAGKLLVTLYPSDAFMRFAATVFARTV